MKPTGTIRNAIGGSVNLDAIPKLLKGQGIEMVFNDEPPAHTRQLLASLDIQVIIDPTRQLEVRIVP